MNIGVFVSDAMCIVVAYFSASELLTVIIERWYFRFIGGIFFIGFGMVEVLAYRQDKVVEYFNNLTKFQLFLKGFIINTFNPSVFIFWMGAIVIALSNLHYTGFKVFLYFSSTLATVFFFDVLKIYTANRLVRIISPEIMKKIHFIIGILLIVIGLVVVFSDPAKA